MGQPPRWSPARKSRTSQCSLNTPSLRSQSVTSSPTSSRTLSCLRSKALSAQFLSKSLYLWLWLIATWIRLVTWIPSLLANQMCQNIKKTCHWAIRPFARRTQQTRTTKARRCWQITATPAVLTKRVWKSDITPISISSQTSPKKEHDYNKKHMISTSSGQRLILMSHNSVRISN